MARVLETRLSKENGTSPQRLTGVENAAHDANVSTRTIRRYISEGRITGYCVGPRLVKVDLDDIDRLAVPIPTAGGGSDAA